MPVAVNLYLNPTQWENVTVSPRSKPTHAPNGFMPAKGARVADIGSPSFLGTVETDGAWVSEVRWYDKQTRGALQFVPNECLILIKVT